MMISQRHNIKQATLERPGWREYQDNLKWTAAKKRFTNKAIKLSALVIGLLVSAYGIFGDLGGKNTGRDRTDGGDPVDVQGPSRCRFAPSLRPGRPRARSRRPGLLHSFRSVSSCFPARDRSRRRPAARQRARAHAAWYEARCGSASTADAYSSTARAHSCSFSTLEIPTLEPWQDGLTTTGIGRGHGIRASPGPTTA